MELTIQPNKLHDAEQIITVDNNILTLIGENGCGKSAILESIFRQHLENTEVNLVCFSSGQNESFSDLYADFIKNSRKVKFEARPDQLKIDFINSFYFDYDWSKVLIFFASALKKEGFTRNLLSAKYLDVDAYNDDISTKLKVNIRVQKNYINQIETSLRLEELSPDEATLRKTNFHTLLGKLIEKKVNPDYEFTDNLNKSVFEIIASEVADIFGRDVNNIFAFLSAAVANDYFLSIQETELQLKNGLKLKDLSDGEYQLLSVYSIIDLFDSPETLFLFDEIDSHLHYRNLENLWQVALKALKGEVIATTHISDSIVKNKYESIRLVEQGVINNSHVANDILNRLNLLSGSSEYVFKISSDLEYLALVEDKTDWIIFETLAKKKLAADFNNEKFSKIQFIKCESDYVKEGDDFGGKKKQWIKDFKRYNSEISTKKIFLICDRDEFSIKGLLPENDPKAIANPELLCEVKGSPFENMPEFKKGKKPHLLSWRRREIENYLVCNKVLEDFNLTASFRENHGNANVPQSDFTGNNDVLIIGDFKELLKEYLYKTNSSGTIDIGRWDYSKLQAILELIPASEVPADIINMYNYIINRID